MRLIRIRLAGFKSFVDPTTFVLPGQLVGIVGPNGCGKSNIIDAVRWVLGESSARSLRGESMADVIFNGSSARKPVGQASIELIFDNSAGRLSGPWAQYNEIAVKRVVSRSGQSSYYLNNTRCRRRDVTGLFLGTGLGPRSYAIIEQGMIARVIESRPEELRIFLEEAAGISRYKERRKETETRIRHTRENLEQLDTLRGELDRQLDTLKRQARNAERYREYRAEERRLKAELLALRWRSLDTERAQRQQQLQQQELALEAQVTAQRHLETQLIQQRLERQQASDRASNVQEQVYQLGSEITRLEQARLHRQELHSRFQAEQARLRESLQQLDSQQAEDQQQLTELEKQIQQLSPTLGVQQQQAEEANTHYQRLEAAQQAAQQAWEAATRAHARHQQAASVSRTRIEYLENQQLSQQRRLEQIQLAQKSLQQQDDGELDILQESLDEATTERNQQQQALQDLEAQLNALNHQAHTLVEAIHSHRQTQQSLQGRLSALETLQAAMQPDPQQQRWLAQREVLATLPRLSEILQVHPDWETALETVLSQHLDMCWTDTDLEHLMEHIDESPPGGFGLLAAHPDDPPPPPGSLQEQVRHPPLPEQLHPVRTVADLPSALAQRQQLAPGESLITPEGIWLGRHWLRFRRPSQDPGHGILAREREIREIQQGLITLESDLAQQQQTLEHCQEQRSTLESQQRDLTTQQRELHAQVARLQAELQAAQRRQSERQERREALQQEAQDLTQEQRDCQEQLIETRQDLAEILLDMEASGDARDQAEAQRQHTQTVIQTAREQARQQQEQLQQTRLALETRQAQRRSTLETLQRLAQQQQRAQQRLAELEPPEAQNDDSEHLHQLLAQRLQADNQLTEARQQLSQWEATLGELESRRSELDQTLQQQRHDLEAQRLAWGEARIRAQGLQEQLAELEARPTETLAQLPTEANEADWETKLGQVGERIQRLGAVNLAAIDEFTQQSERKQYLDSQHADLSEALATLENAIRQIDRETRERLRDTFERVNQDLQALFPRLFGGGEAHLKLTGEDLLDAGVAVMARPPGKRIGSINLLSGGEKTLTAIALVFAIFQLNPAPFCMLDEVDAPLDEANVRRFGELLQEMAGTIQFIVITHNKATMGIMEYLSGVTMGEPGVSRVVAVDVDEALGLAAV